MYWSDFVLIVRMEFSCAMGPFLKEHRNVHENYPNFFSILNWCGSRILPRWDPTSEANIAKWSHSSKASYLQPGYRPCLRALEAFGFSIFKYAYFHFLETLFLLLYSQHVVEYYKLMKIVYCTSIHLRYFMLENFRTTVLKIDKLCDIISIQSLQR